MSEELVDRVVALEAKVERLESGVAAAGSVGTDPGRFWALHGLLERAGEHGGQVLFTGATELPTGEHYRWQQGASTAELLELDWADHAGAFAALGHPVRLSLLQHILGGTRTAAALQENAELGTTGQLYHHLKQLLAAGWLQAEGRGRYAVPGERVIPLLVLLAGTVKVRDSVVEEGGA